MEVKNISENHAEGNADTINANEVAITERIHSEVKYDSFNSRIDYNHASSYWSNVEPSVNGMLGGYGYISPIDLSGSEKFIKWIFTRKERPGHGRCVDCGAGIGRITQKLLQRHFGKVDMVEQSSVFTEIAKGIFAGNPKIGDIFCCGLQDFNPPPSTYDVVWVQWVLIYLPDGDLVKFFRRMGESLKPGGMVVVKENFTTAGSSTPADSVYDEEDSSVTRPLDYVINLAKDAGLSLVRSVQQQKFPKHLFKVFMLAFKPLKYSN